jgi:hypothetical protein
VRHRQILRSNKIQPAKRQCLLHRGRIPLQIDGPRTTHTNQERARYFNGQKVPLRSSPEQGPSEDHEAPEQPPTRWSEETTASRGGENSQTDGEDGTDEIEVVNCPLPDSRPTSVVWDVVFHIGATKIP